MPKRPDILGAARKMLDPGRERSGKTHPVGRFTDDQGRVLDLPLDRIHPNPDQPRRHFDATKLRELADSIREHGLLHPVLVRKDEKSDVYVLIAGERRYRAVSTLGWPKIRAIVDNQGDPRLKALIENVQRENLTPIEEAEYLLTLKQGGGYTDEDLAKVVGKSRTSITESLALTRLPDSIKAECRTFDIGSKIQLLQVVRAGSSDQQLAAWQALRSGAAATVRELRRQTRPSAGERSQRYQHIYRGRTFRLSLTFQKAKVTPKEVRDALAEAERHVS